MTIAVTAATGQLGRLVVEDLLARGVPAGQIVAGARTPDRLGDLAARGVQVRRADYDDPRSLVETFDGVGTALLISGNELGRRVPQHTAAARAAQQAGVSLLAYTSAPHADTTSLGLAVEHRETEQAIRRLGIPFTFLRNSWYQENYTAQIPTYLEYGAVLGSSGEGRISGASRADFAAAAAAVLTGEGHQNRVYELGGDTAFTLAELAAVVAQASGKPVVYRDLPVEEFRAALVAAGLPEPVAAGYADADRAIREGALLVETGDLGRLIGRPTTTLREAVTAALR
jgi:NAD(P)H dehydrogenase (quinone)